MPDKHDFTKQYTEQEVMNLIAWYIAAAPGPANTPNAIGVVNPDGTKIASAIGGAVTADITKVGGTAQTGADWSSYLSTLAGKDFAKESGGNLATLAGKDFAKESGGNLATLAGKDFAKESGGNLATLAGVSFSTSTKQGDGSQKSQIVDGAGNVVGAATGNALDVRLKSDNVGIATSTKQGDGSQKTQVVDGSGNVISSTGNALNVRLNADGVGLATDAHITGGSQKSQIVDGAGNVVGAATGNALDVRLKSDNVGVATAAKQDTGNNSLSSIDGKLPTIGQQAANASLSTTPSAKIIDLCDATAGWSTGGMTLTAEAGGQTMGTSRLKAVLDAGAGGVVSTMAKTITSVNLNNTGNLVIKMRVYVPTTAYFSLFYLQLGTDSTNKIILTTPTAKLKAGGASMILEWRVAECDYQTGGTGADFSAITYLMLDIRRAGGPPAHTWYIDGIWAEWSQQDAANLGVVTKDISRSVVPASDSPDFPVLTKGYYETPLSLAPYSGVVLGLKTTKAGRLLVELERQDTAWYYTYDGALAQTNTVIKAAPGANKAIRVLGFRFSAGAAQTGYLDDGDGVKVIGTKYLAANGNTGGPCYKTVTTNKSLRLTTANAVNHSFDVWGDVVDI